jgi:hypothetical protein
MCDSRAQRDKADSRREGSLSPVKVKNTQWDIIAAVYLFIIQVSQRDHQVLVDHVPIIRFT